MAGLPTQYKLAVSDTQAVYLEPIVLFTYTVELTEMLRKQIERDKRYVKRFYHEVRDGKWYVCAEAV